jgi:hypothetical protein
MGVSMLRREARGAGPVALQAAGGVHTCPMLDRLVASRRPRNSTKSEERLTNKMAQDAREKRTRYGRRGSGPAVQSTASRRSTLWARPSWRVALHQNYGIRYCRLELSSFRARPKHSSSVLCEPFRPDTRVGHIKIRPCRNATLSLKPSAACMRRSNHNLNTVQ